MNSATKQVRPDRRLVPTAVLDVLRTLRGAGKQAYLAGGAVRDLLRIAQGEKLTPPQDFDVATDALPEDVQRLFRRTAPTGIAHGTVTVLADAHKVEVTTFRRDAAYSDGRHPDSVSFSSPGLPSTQAFIVSGIGKSLFVFTPGPPYMIVPLSHPSCPAFSRATGSSPVR